MSLKLSLNQLSVMQAHAESTYPEECCGLLLGHRSRETEDKVLLEVWQTENTWTPDLIEEIDLVHDLAKTRRYWIDPKDLLAAQHYARDRQFDIIGIYHSHTDHAAVPSECDRRYAWSQYSYMIISVNQGVAQDSRCWSLDQQHQFQPEAMMTV